MLSSSNHHFYKIVDTQRVDTPMEASPLSGLTPNGEVVGWYRFEVFGEAWEEGLGEGYGFEEFPWVSEWEDVVREYWATMERDKRSCVKGGPHVRAST